MIVVLKKLIARMAGDAGRQDIAEDERRLAAAALLVHVATIDGVTSDAENARVLALLEQRFGLSPEEAEELAHAAHERDREAIDFYAFTSVLKDKLDEAGRRDIVDMMWDVAFADGAAHEFEENVIWRVAELLAVPPRDRMAARKRAARAHLERD